MKTGFCHIFSRYLVHQREHLSRAIDEHKWYMSERAGFDVGLRAAKQDFLDRHMDRVTRDFRLAYCSGACDARGGCAMAGEVEHIPSLRDRGAKGA